MNEDVYKEINIKNKKKRANGKTIKVRAKACTYVHVPTSERSCSTGVR